jgi:tripartite-type tricarboxylate transporter receptor subunit TctC
MRLESAKKLSDVIVKGIGSEGAIKRIRESGASELPGNTEDLARHIVAERTKWKRVIDAAKLVPQ